MRPRILIGSALTSILILLAGTLPGSDLIASTELKFVPHLVSGMRVSEIIAIQQTLKRLHSIRLNAHPTSFYARIFGGTGQDAALNFLNRRIRHIVSQNVKAEDLLYLGRPIPLDSLPPHSRQSHSSSGFAAEEEESAEAILVAYNLGTLLWMDYLALGTSDSGFVLLDGLYVPLHSSRIGLIQLASGFTARDPSDSTKFLFSPIERAAALVHEARHSDCTGGMSPSDVALIRSGQSHENLACGHFHSKCPEWHTLADLEICDQHPWGAYSIGAIYLSALATSCETCTEVEKKEAELAAWDALDRVLVLEDMVSGKLGTPDMSSQGALAK